MPQQGPSNGALGKDLSIESNLAKESIVSGSKLDTHITGSQETRQELQSLTTKPVMDY